MVWICTSCSNFEGSILLLLSRVNQFSSKICSRGPSLGKWRSIEESELNLNLNHCEMSKFMLTCFLLVHPRENLVPLSFLCPPPSHTQTNTHGQTQTPQRQGLLQDVTDGSNTQAAFISQEVTEEVLMRVLSVYPVRLSRQQMNNRHCGSIL